MDPTTEAEHPQDKDIPKEDKDTLKDDKEDDQVTHTTQHLNQQKTSQRGLPSTIATQHTTMMQAQQATAHHLRHPIRQTQDHAQKAESCHQADNHTIARNGSIPENVTKRALAQIIIQ